MADSPGKVTPPTVVKDNTQETNFMLAGHGNPGSDNLQASRDEMVFPQGTEVSKGAGEKAVSGFRQPT